MTLPTWAQITPSAVILSLYVSPRAKREGFGPEFNGALRIAIKAPPVDGKANEAIIRLLAEALSVPRSIIEVVRGERGRTKKVRISSANSESIVAKLKEVAISSSSER